MQHGENIEGENCCNQVCICALIMTLFVKKIKRFCGVIRIPTDSSTWSGLENIWTGLPQLMQSITLVTNPQ